MFWQRRLSRLVRRFDAAVLNSPFQYCGSFTVSRIFFTI